MYTATEEGISKSNSIIAENIGRRFFQMLNLFLNCPKDKIGIYESQFGEINLFISFVNDYVGDSMTPCILYTKYLLTKSNNSNKRLNVKQLPEDNNFSFSDEKHNVHCYGKTHTLSTTYEVVFSTNIDNVLLDYLIRKFNEYIPLIINDIESACDYNGIIDQAIRSYLSSFSIDVNTLILLSSQKYESNDTRCNLILTVNSELQCAEPNFRIKLQDSFAFSADNLRQIRKFAEIAKTPLALSIDINNKVVGFEEISTRENAVKVEVLGHLSFTFMYRDTVINYNNGVFRFIVSQNIEYYLRDYSGINKDYYDNINTITTLAKERGHGTVLIFGNKESIEYEVKRLGDLERGSRIEPVSLLENPDIISNITAIDGAIMIDENGICYGIGFILDGDAVINGKTSRGARYNATVNYIMRIYNTFLNNKDEILKKNPSLKKRYDCKKSGWSDQVMRFIGVIISEDNTIDFWI